MAKATVLKCDKCGVWDSDETPVRTVTVVGPRPDLCQRCRVNILTMIQVSPGDATKYVLMMDMKAPGVGTNWSVKHAVAEWDKLNAPTDTPESDEETEDNQPDPLDEKAEPVGENAPVLALVDGSQTVDVSTEDTANGDHDSVEVLPAELPAAQTTPVRKRATSRK